MVLADGMGGKEGGHVATAIIVLEIHERGIQLLTFVENRWAISIRDEDRERLLFLGNNEASSVWISNDGLMYTGFDALVHGTGAHDRERLDSV